MTDTIHIIGASGRSGLALSQALRAEGMAITPVVRSLQRWEATGLPVAAREANLLDAAALERALDDARVIVSCAHARFTPQILRAAPSEARFVLLGSTRKFTRWPDAHGNGVLAGETALLQSGRQGVMLHPTMIYGAEGEDNVQRLAALMRKTRVMPLPGGGRFLIQPIHQSDVTRSILAALRRDWPEARSCVIAGPSPVSYADFVRAVAAAAGLTRPLILPFPAGPLTLAARLTRHVTVLPSIAPEEVRRLLEDKAFDISEMRALLAVEPIPLAEGLAQTFMR
jgi:nucleoside-diphosphate-sugar epimerase